MARTARFTDTLPPMKVAPAVAARVRSEADVRGVSLAEVVRDALDERYDEDAVETAPAPEE